MPTLTITKSYANSTILNDTNLDYFKTALETFVNTTKLDSSNVNCDSVALGMTSTGANAIVSSMSSAASLGIVDKSTSTEGYRLHGTSAGASAATSPNYASSASFSITNTTYGGGPSSIDHATVTITARNRPIMVLLQSSSTALTTAEGTFVVTASGTAGVYLVKDGVTLERIGLYATSSGTQYYPLSAICFVDLTPGTGSKVYSLSAYTPAGQIAINNAVLVAIEL